MPVRGDGRLVRWTWKTTVLARMSNHLVVDECRRPQLAELAVVLLEGRWTANVAAMNRQ